MYLLPFWEGFFMDEQPLKTTGISRSVYQNGGANKMKHNANRLFSGFLALVMAVSLAVPPAAFAAEADKSLCRHHPEHTGDCGYIAPTEGRPCSHEHTEECYTWETVCVHVHDENCLPDAAPDAPVQDEDAAPDVPSQGEDGSDVLPGEDADADAPGEDADNGDARPGEDGGTEAPVQDESGSEALPTEDAGTEAPVQDESGSDVLPDAGTDPDLSAQDVNYSLPLDEGGEKAPDACTHVCTVESGCVTRVLNCAHEHDGTCGYVPADPGQPCGFKCKICPVQKMIDALPDADTVTAESAADVKALLAGIDGARADLSDGELDELDTERYEAAASALLALEGMKGAGQPELLAATTYDISSGTRTLSGGDYIVTGTTTSNRIIISGGIVNMTIQDLALQLPHSDDNRDLMHAGIKLENGATLNLTLVGTNTITGGNMHAGIEVPAGCTLNITAESTGSLTVTGGYGGAGIGAPYTAGTTGGQTVGHIIINGGTVNAYGNRGGAGIGGTNYSATGIIEINGGTVYAKGSASSSLNSMVVAAGIGGGYSGHLESITINGGTVTAVGGETTVNGIKVYSSAIGAGSSSNSCGTITINGGTVDAQSSGGCAIGFGTKPSKTEGSVTIGSDAAVNLNGGRIDPAPPSGQGTTYSITGHVYDTSLAATQEAALTIDGKKYSVTVNQNTSQPYYGTFSTKLFLASSSISSVSLTFGSKTLTGTREISGSSATLTFGTQEYLYSTLHVTVYDKNITGNMNVTLGYGGTTWNGTMGKSDEEPYRGDFTTSQLTLKKSITALTVASGSNRWTANVTPTAGEMTVTLGTRTHIYSKLNVTIYDPAITSDMNVTLSYGGASWNGTMAQSATVPYCGSFTTDVLAVTDSADPIQLQVKSGGKTWTQDVTPAAGEMTATIGSNENQYYTLNGTIHDGRITSGMTAAVTVDGKTHTNVLLTKTGDYTATFTLPKLIAKTGASVSVTVAANGVTWTGTATGESTKTLTIGKPLRHVSLVFLGQEITGDMTADPLAITRGGSALGNDELVLVNGGTIKMTNSGRGVLEIWITEGENTTFSATAAGLNGGQTITQAGLTIQSGTTEITMYERKASALDLANGDVVFKDENGTLKVTYCETWGGETTKELDYDGVHEVVQSNSGTPVAHQLKFENSLADKQIHVRIKDVNIDHKSVSAIDVLGGDVLLDTAGTNNVKSGGTNSPAVYVPEGAALTLGGDGTLNASSTGRGAAIGAASGASSGTITINSGTVNATAANECSAGIGLGYAGYDTCTNIIINGGRVTAQGGSKAAGIGGGGVSAGQAMTPNPTITVTINGGIVEASGGTEGAGIGTGRTGETISKITISGGTITAHTAASGGWNKPYGIGSMYARYNTISITGGTIKTSGGQGAFAKENDSDAPFLRTFTLEGAGDGVPVTKVIRDGDAAYGLKDVYTRDGGQLYFYLNRNEYPQIIQADGVDYVHKGDGKTYVRKLVVEVKDYSGKEYDGTPLELPTEEQVHISNYDRSDLTFEWYQDGTKLDGAPADAGSYKLKISVGNQSEELSVTIGKKPLAIKAKAQTIEYKGRIQTGTTWVDCGELAQGDALTGITLSTDKTDAGTYTGGIAVSGAVITRGGENVAEKNYSITYTPGDLTIDAAVTNVTAWPAASSIKYGQKLGDSALTGGGANIPGSFAWKAPETMPDAAGTAEYEVVFSPTDPNFQSHSQSVSVTVEKAGLAIAASAQTITYGSGIDTDVGQVTVAGLAAGDRLTGVKLTASSDQVAAENKTVRPSAAVIANAGGKNVTDCYEITYQDGGLTIDPKVVSAPVIELALPEGGYEYDGTEKRPTVTVRDGDALIPESEYEVQYAGNTHVGIATVTIKDADGGNYTVSGTTTFEITQPSLSTASVTLDPTAFTYNGAEQTPSVAVVKNGKTVSSNDYTVSYVNTNGGVGDHTHAGTVTLTVTANANSDYSGSKSVEFTISPKPLTPAISGTTSKIYDGTTKVKDDVKIELTGIVGSDDVTATAAFAYNSEKVKEADKITATDIELEGKDAGNYTLSETEISVAASITKDKYATAPGEGEGYTIDYAAETIAVKDGYKVSTAETDGTVVPSGSVKDYFGQTLYICREEDDNHAASGWTEIKLAARPELEGVSFTNETLKDKNDGAVTGLTGLMELELGEGWRDASGDLTGLPGGTTVKVRVKAAPSAPAGEIKTFTIAAGKPITVTLNMGNPAIGGEARVLENQSYGKLKPSPEEPKPQNEDYRFDGWYKDAQYQEKWDFESDFLDAEAVTLYAKWKQVRFRLGVTVTDNGGGKVPGADVVLKQGNHVEQSGKTGADGKFTFPTSVQAGAYNVVITSGEQTTTSLVTIQDGDVNETVKLPPQGANSELFISGANTPDIVVGGLDDESAALKTADSSVQKITVSMSVEEKPETAVTDTIVTAIRNAATAAAPIVEYLDIAVEKRVNGGAAEALTTTSKVMEIVIPFVSEKRGNLKVIRYHDAAAEELTKVETKPAGNYQDKQYYLGDGYLYIYANCFSTYAVAYSAEYIISFDAGEGTVTTQNTKSDGTLGTLPAAPTRNGYTFGGWYTEAGGGKPVTASTVFQEDATVYAHWTKGNSGSGGSGGSSSSVYTFKPTVTVEGDKSGGTVTATTNSVTIVTKNGYKAVKVTVNGKEVPVPADGELTGLRPSDKVNVTFEKVSGDISVSQRFIDVAADAWYEEAIQFAVDNGLFNGTTETTFSPDSFMSRGMLAAVLYRMAGEPVVQAYGSFADVAADKYYAAAVAWASANGIVGGYGNGTFGPNDPITREQLAAMLWRYAGSPAVTERELLFADADQAGAFSREALKWAVENGILNGYGDGRLNPRGQATRAQVAAMLMRYMKDMQK